MLFSICKAISSDILAPNFYHSDLQMDGQYLDADCGVLVSLRCLGWRSYLSTCQIKLGPKGPQ